MAIISASGSSPLAAAGSRAGRDNGRQGDAQGRQPPLQRSRPWAAFRQTLDAQGPICRRDGHFRRPAQRNAIASRRAQARPFGQPHRGPAACCPSGGVAQWRKESRTIGGSGRPSVIAGPSRRPGRSNRGQAAHTAIRPDPQYRGNPYPWPNAASTRLRLSSHVKVRNRHPSQRAAATSAATTTGMRNPNNSKVVND